MFFKKGKMERLKKKLQKLYAARIEGRKELSSEEIIAYFKLAEFYKKNKKYDPEGIYQLECYRAAARLGDANAQYFCGKAFLEKAHFWEKWSQSMFGAEIHRKYTADYFAEALGYLAESEEQGHPLAKRLHGLSYIRGWGVPKDVDKGFELIIASIEQEGAWNRVTKIFEQLGLNTPEFFSRLHGLHQKQ